MLQVQVVEGRQRLSLHVKMMTMRHWWLAGGQENGLQPVPWLTTCENYQQVGHVGVVCEVEMVVEAEQTWQQG